MKMILITIAINMTMALLVITIVCYDDNDKTLLSGERGIGHNDK